MNFKPKKQDPMHGSDGKKSLPTFSAEEILSFEKEFGQTIDEITTLLNRSFERLRRNRKLKSKTQVQFGFGSVYAALVSSDMFGLGPVSKKQISDAKGAPPSTVAHQLKSFEKQGFIESQNRKRGRPKTSRDENTKGRGRPLKLYSISHELGIENIDKVLTYLVLSGRYQRLKKAWNRIFRAALQKGIQHWDTVRDSVSDIEQGIKLVGRLTGKNVDPVLKQIKDYKPSANLSTEISQDTASEELSLESIPETVSRLKQIWPYIPPINVEKGLRDH